MAVVDEGGLWWAKAQAMRRESQGLEKAPGYVQGSMLVRSLAQAMRVKKAVS